jgi:hypothetical protein
LNDEFEKKRLVKITIKIMRTKFDIKKGLTTHFGLIESVRRGNQREKRERERNNGLSKQNKRPLLTCIAHGGRPQQDKSDDTKKGWN